MSAFKSALTRLKAELLHHSNRLEKEEDVACLTPLHLQSLEKNSIIIVHDRRTTRNNEGGATTRRVDEDDLHQYFIFSHAIPIIQGHLFSTDERESTKVYIAIVVFNLALTFHLASIKSGNRRSLVKAQSLYEKCFDLLAPIIKAYCCKGRATHNTIFDLLVMALLNNLALVYLDVVDPIQSCATFQLLAKYATIVSFVRSRRKARLARHLPSDEQEASWTTERIEQLDSGSDDSSHSFFFGEVNRMLLNVNLVKVAMASPPVAPAA